jgi:CubicO group peptidase (beta-lactamase class C family)
MRRRDFVSTALIASLGCAAAPEPTPLDEAADLIRSQVDAGKLTAATVAVNNGGEPFRRAFGAAESDDAVFLIASISKPMTATGVMLLADRGELSLSDPVMKFIPEFAEGDRKLITIEHLLTHTSGLPDQLPNNNELRAAHAPLSEFVAGAVKVPLKFSPGAEYSYQSMGILLASEVVQRITGTRFRDFLRDEVFRPLGMERTVMGLAPFTLEEVMTSQVEFAAAEGGAGDPSTRDWDWNSPYWRDLGAPWGGGHSTSPDIERFVRSFLSPDDHVLKPETVRAMITNHTPHLDVARGLGFQMGSGFAQGCSAASYGHSGSTGTSTWCDPERDLSCVILTTLPSRASRDLILAPVSELVSAGA